MQSKRETRHHQTEIRAASDGSTRTLEGYAAQYNVLSTPLYDPQLGEFFEILLPGAFADAVVDADCTCNIDHDDHELLGRTPTSLVLTDDETGLHFVCSLPDTAAGQKAYTHVDRGDIRSCSFAFDVLDESWDTTPDGAPLRQVKKVKLYDVAIVIRPAYEFETQLSVRSLDLAKQIVPPPVAPEALSIPLMDRPDPHAWRRLLLDLSEKS